MRPSRFSLLRSWPDITHPAALESIEEVHPAGAGIDAGIGTEHQAIHALGGIFQPGQRLAQRTIDPQADERPVPAPACQSSSMKCGASESAW